VPAAEGRGAKYLSALKVWPRSVEAMGLPFSVQDEAAIGLFRKEQLPRSENHEGIDAAADDQQDKRDNGRRFDFFENVHGKWN
jgi:hypothetical protein